MSTIFLRVKINSLAEEAKIIRREERRRKRKDPLRLELIHHRKHAVRPEARASLLAYGFLRGRPYRTIEVKCYQQPAWDNVARLAAKYGTQGGYYSKEQFAATAAAVKDWHKEGEPK